MSKAIIRNLGQFIMASLNKPFAAPQMPPVETRGPKIRSNVVRPIKPKSLEIALPVCRNEQWNPWKTIGRYDVTIAIGELMNRWCRNRPTAVNFKTVSTPVKREFIYQLSERNHINDWCTEFPDHRLYGACYERGAR